MKMDNNRNDINVFLFFSFLSFACPFCFFNISFWWKEMKTSKAVG